MNSEAQRLPIAAITPFSMLDFPDKLACIVWFSGCNLACPYCYNVEFLENRGSIAPDEVLAFLDSRQGLLDGVVLSGGEPTIYGNLAAFAAQIKARNFLIKLDTNGANPSVLGALIKKNLLDFVALDFKTTKEKEKIFGKSGIFEAFLESLRLLAQGGVDFIVRTTLHSEILGANDLAKMREILDKNGYTKPHFLQHFVSDKKTLRPLSPHDRARFAGLKNAVVTN